MESSSNSNQKWNYSRSRNKFNNLNVHSNLNGIRKVTSEKQFSEYNNKNTYKKKYLHELSEQQSQIKVQTKKEEYYAICFGFPQNVSMLDIMTLGEGFGINKIEMRINRKKYAQKIESSPCIQLRIHFDKKDDADQFAKKFNGLYIDGKWKVQILVEVKQV